MFSQLKLITAIVFRVDNMNNLLVMGLMAPSMEGAVLSPTFSCLLAKVNAWEFNVAIAWSSVADPDPVPF
jgi:hypothetical protein